MDDEYILEILADQGFLDADQVEQIRQQLFETDKDVVTLLEEAGIISEPDLLQVLAQEYGMDVFDLTDYRIPEDLIAQVPADVAKRFKIVPVMAHDNTLTVAVSNPIHAVEILDSLSYILRRDVLAVVVPRDQIRRAINTYYGTNEEAVQAIIEEVTQGDVEIEFSDQNAALEDGDSTGDDAPIIRLVSLIIVNAYNSRASDIHLEPLEKRFRVRYRIDGVLIEVESPPKYLQNNVIQRLKIMARLDIAEKRVPQDGRIMFKMPGKTIDLRVSTVPTVHGESIVMRILDKSSIQLGIPELGFFHDDQQLIERIINMPDGIFLVTGPTGSGKTTSLYAFLNTLNTPNRKIITAEDPVEYELSGINQVQCDKERLTFAKALRAMLRQAPNIIMVGEIRDIETGAIAINAALTGHLVFSTL
ncbi:MAG: type II/IV secretion system protein, partial [Lentisphaerae bacterium]